MDDSWNDGDTSTSSDQVSGSEIGKDEDEIGDIVYWDDTPPTPTESPLGTILKHAQVCYWPPTVFPFYLAVLGLYLPILCLCLI